MALEGRKKSPWSDTIKLRMSIIFVGSPVEFSKLCWVSGPDKM